MAQRRVEDKLELLRQHYESGVPWNRLAAEARVPPRTLSRWAAAYRTDPTHSGLKRRQRGDRGCKKIPAELVEVIEALALRRPAPTMAFICRRVGDIARDRELPAPSYSSVRAVVTAIDPGLITLAQEGDAAYRDRFELVFRRAASRPNKQWQAELFKVARSTVYRIVKRTLAN